jgi:transcriptional regulator with XRE-family HTH domain
MSDQEASPAEAIRTEMDKQLARIREALSDRNLTKVAMATGLHENTVRNFAKGKGGTPTLTTIEKLASYLFG